MKGHERGHTYLLMAEKDLLALGRMIEVGGFADEIFGLHAQQAAEKTLKACLCFLDITFGRIHDIEALGDLLHDAGVSFIKPLESLLFLTDFAVVFRYEPYDSFDMPLDREFILKQLSALYSNARDMSERL